MNRIRTLAQRALHSRLGRRLRAVLRRGAAAAATPEGLSIHPSARFSPAQAHMKPGCTLHIGEMSMVGGTIFFERPDAHVEIGDRTFVGGSSIMCATRVSIGHDVLVSFGVTITDHDSHALEFSKRRDDVVMWYNGQKNWEHVKTNPVRIADKAWIGMHAIILEGVSIGEGAVVGAGAVVTRDVPPYVAVAGNPARVIREIGR